MREPVKLPEPAACFIETERWGVMLWPIGDIHEARLYCDEGEEPQLLYTADQMQECARRAVEACAQIAESVEAGDGSHDYNAGAGMMQERIAAAIRGTKEGV
ncbi:MAG TPA: hypothetical protein VFM12_01455 [Gemmatimonadales bacterium]|nr:hypothetical protein [Gemmatimonadales bacterium]